mgnify:CR=1 FL=1
MKFLYSKAFIKQIFLAIIIFSVIVLISILFLFFYTKQTSKISVPNLIGLQLSDVEKIVEENKLRYEVIDSSFFNPDYDKNTVLDQIPKSKKNVKKNRKIYLTINPSNYRNVAIPDIIQITKRSAIAALLSSDLELGEITLIDNIGKDMVIKIIFEKEEVDPGFLVPKKSKIDLVLGNGIKL